MQFPFICRSQSQLFGIHTDIYTYTERQSLHWSSNRNYKTQSELHLSFNYHATNWAWNRSFYSYTKEDINNTSMQKSLQTPLQNFPWGRNDLFVLQCHWDWASLTNKSLLHSHQRPALGHASLSRNIQCLLTAVPVQWTSSLLVWPSLAFGCKLLKVAG